MPIRPIDIARKLNISTSALRHYEEWGIVPPVERAANGYRLYTEEHVAYFECIRTLNLAFGMDITKEVLIQVQKKQVERVMWLITEQQAMLLQDKISTERAIQMLETKELELVDKKGRSRFLSIGEVSEQTKIPSTAIRHWEKMGLIAIPRDQENGYRRFSASHVRQALVIHVLRRSIWSLEVIKQVLDDLNHNHVERARQIAQQSLRNLNRKNQFQMKGIHTLYRLLHLLKLVD
ncbi:MAG: transcriptional regulator, MerR family protein [Paenibacillus sp.]|jgi:DNA-binding transcriptional MerR regulator|nr:transcriptional regulator, MerR family protein [Paenibacillus sp.]